MREPFCFLTGKRGDGVKVLVDVQYRQARQFGCRGDEQIRDRRATVVSAVGKQGLHLERTVFTSGLGIPRASQTAAVHETPVALSPAFGREPYFQACHARDVYQAAFDPVRPDFHVRAVREPHQRRLVDQPALVSHLHA